MMAIDLFTSLLAFSSGGHEELTCIGIALAISRLVSLGKTALLTKLGRLYDQTRPDPVMTPRDKLTESLRHSYRDAVGPVPASAEGPLQLFMLLPGRVVDEDIHAGNIPYIGGWFDHEGQVRHFMRSGEDVSSDDAYNASVGYIREHLTEAWRVGSKTLGEMENRPVFFDPFLADSYTWKDELAKALHTVEDSFAPGHVSRNSHERIEVIHIWDSANRQENRATGWPGHSALDNPANPLTAPHFDAAKSATRDALLCVLLNLQRPANEFQAALNSYMVTQFARA